MKIFLTLIVFCLCVSVNAQKFITKKNNEALTFKEMQRQFNDWAKMHDLKKEKNWKYYKRWEMEMQMHTDAKGEPADPSIFIKEAIKAADNKKNIASSKSQLSAWYPVGPNAVPANQTGYMENGIGRINCVAFHPFDPSTYFAGVAQGGLWKTSNNGDTWIPLTDNLPIIRISDIAIDYNNPDVMYISLCDFESVGTGVKFTRMTPWGLGVYKTTDGGQTWNPTGLTFQLMDANASLIRKTLINSTNSNKLVACGVSGMFTSNDAGVTWTKKLDSLFWDLIQDPVNPNTLYAATGWVKNLGQGRAGIYKSTDFGSTWALLNTGIPETGFVQRIKLAIAPSDNNYIYALAVDDISGLYGFYKSKDAGANWEFINPGLNILESGEGFNTGGQGTYDLGLMVEATNKESVYVGGVNMWGSDDGCQTFNPISHWTTNYGPTTHADVHFIEQQPLTGNIFVCNDGGIYRTTNIVIGSWSDANNGVPWPTQWTNISDGMATTSFYRISSSKNNTGRLIGGAQDNATFYFDGTSWITSLGGDGMDNYLDPQDDYFFLGSAQYGRFFYSNDNGGSWNETYANINYENAEWTSPLVADYNNYGILYTGFENVHKSFDGGYSWSTISSFPTNFYNNEICGLAVSNSNSNVIYAAKRPRYEYDIPGSLFKTEDGGNSWDDVTDGLPDSLYFTGLEISENDHKTVYVTVAQFYAGNKVYKTTNGGITWNNISYDLPNIPMKSIKYIPGTNTIIVATDLGVYTLTEGETNWVNKSAGLPNVIVSDIEFNTVLNKAYISTYGRGIWATDISSLVSSTKNISKASLNFELYPNINKGIFNISLQGNLINDLINFEIIDVTGRILFKSILSNQSLQNFNLNLPSGMYFAKLIGKELSVVKTFVVE